MKFLADESVDFPVYQNLKDKGFQIEHISKISPGIPDDQVFELSLKDGCILLTADKDFGEIVFRLRKINSGIVLLRLNGLSNYEKIKVVSGVFDNYSDSFKGHFIVVEKDNVRSRKLDFYE